MQQVIIEFTSDASGLAPAEQALQGLTEQEKALANQSLKTSSTMAEQGKTIATSATQSGKSVEQLSNQFKMLDKSVIGGAYKKVFDDIRKNLSLTDKELKAFYQNVIKNSRTQLLDSNLAAEDFDALQQLVVTTQEALDSMGESETKVGEKSLSMRQRLKELKNELQQLEDQGKDNTAEFEAMQVEAGKLQDQIGDTNARIQALASDTFVFDALTGAVQGLAGGFAVAQGAAALFGDENEDLQKALLKVNAAMAILQGLQQIQNTLQAQSSVMIGLSVLRTQALAIAQKFLAATTLESAAATGVLRSALIASGIGAVAVVIGLAVTAFQSLNKEVENSTDRMKRLSEEAENTYDALQKIAKVTQQGVDRQIDIIKNQEYVKLLEAQGATIETINSAKKSGLQIEKQSLELELFNVKEAQKIAEDKTQFTQRELDIKAKIYQNDKAQLLLDLEIAKAARERAAKSSVGFAEAEVARRKKAIIDNQIDSIASIEAVAKAERNLIRERLANELALNKIPGERAKLIAEANLAISENYNDTFNKIFEFNKERIKSELSIVKEGSKDELQLKIDLLEQEKQQELNANVVTNAQRREIENRYQKERLDLIKAYNKQVAEDTINTQAAQTNAQISALTRSNVSATNDELLRLKKEQVDQQAALEVVSITDSEKNEELRREKIKAVYAKALADKIKLEDDKLRAEMDRDDAYIQNVYKLGIAQQQAVLNNTKSSDEQRAEALRKINVFTEAQSNAELSALEDLHNNKLLTEEQYLDALLALKLRKQEEQNAILLQQAQIQAQKEQTIREAAFNVANQLISALNENIQTGYQDDLQAARDLYDQKIISEKEYNNRQKQLKRQAAIAEKEAAIFQIFLDTQQKAMAIQAQRALYLSNPVTAPLAALASTQLISLYITEAITAGLVAARKIPQYRTGEIDINGPGTSTSDSIIARISRGESVINAQQTGKWKPALEAINNDTFESWLKNIALPQFYPAMPAAVPDDMKFQEPTFSFDYNKMAKSFSEELANNPQVLLKVDKDGLNTYVVERNRITEIKNRDFEL